MKSYKDFLEILTELDSQDDKLRNKFDSSDTHHHVQESWPYIPQHSDHRLYQFVVMCEQLGKYLAEYKSLTEATASLFGRPDLQLPQKAFCLKVLDVGAGTGRIVKLLKECGINAAGIEFFEPYAEAGRKKFKLSEQELIVGDAFKMTPEFLQEFNVIYTYMPIKNPRRMSELHVQLFHTTSCSTVLTEMYPVYYPLIEGGDWSREFPFSIVYKRDFAVFFSAHPKTTRQSW